VAQLVEALRYKAEGRGFSFRWRWFHLNIYRYKSSGRTMVLGSTQPLTEMSTRYISWMVKWPVRVTHNLNFHMPIVLKSRSLNLPELSGREQVCTGIALSFLSTECETESCNTAFCNFHTIIIKLTFIGC